MDDLAHGEILADNRGFALISSMIFLVVLTVIGIAATNTATIETMISASEKNRQMAFFAAEAGVEHGKMILKDRAGENFKQTRNTDWDFALDASGPNVTATDYTSRITGEESFIWIRNRALGATAQYTVMVRNNEDGGAINDDTDGIIVLTSLATLNDGTSAGVEISLSSLVHSGTATGYSAQEGAGSGKSYKSDDVNKVSSLNDIQPSVTPK